MYAYMYLKKKNRTLLSQTNAAGISWNKLAQARLRALIAGVELVLGQREIGAYQNGVAAC